jgi:hypothetical protein
MVENLSFDGKLIEAAENQALFVDFRSPSSEKRHTPRDIDKVKEIAITRFGHGNSV